MILRTVFLVACAAGALLAQATVTVNGPMADPSLVNATGTATIRITAPCVYAGTRIGQRDITARVTGGSFSVPLVPNDACRDDGGQYRTRYTVTWTLQTGRTWQEVWLVPSSPASTTIGAVIFPATPPLITGAQGATGPQGPSGAEYVTPAFTNVTSVSVLAATHLLLNPTFAGCFDGSGNYFDPGS